MGIGTTELQKDYYAILGPTIVKKLERRNFTAWYCSTHEEAVELALTLIPESDQVAFGGSVTLEEIGMIDTLYKREQEIINRDLAKSLEERHQLMKKSLLSDTYLTSLNGITEDGLLVNLDSVGNRVAAITYGPDQVIAFVGMNKIYPSVEEAVKIIRGRTAPLNSLRLKLEKTPCVKNGLCGDCLKEECICSTISIMRRCKLNGRIKIILIGEELGL